MERRAEPGGVAGMEGRCAPEEACRAYAMRAAQLYRWKRSLDQELKGPAS